MKVKPYIEERARERSRANLKQNTENTQNFADSQKISTDTECENSRTREKPVRTDEILAKKADVSSNTIRRVEKILEKAKPEVIEKARAGEISINQAYQTVKPARKQDCSILSTAFSALLNFHEYMKKGACRILHIPSHSIHRPHPIDDNARQDKHPADEIH